MKQKHVLIAIGIIAAVIVYRRVYGERFTPIYCSSRSNNCADLGSREHVTYL